MTMTVAVGVVMIYGLSKTYLDIIYDKLSIFCHVLQQTARRTDHYVTGTDALPLVFQVLST